MKDGDVRGLHNHALAGNRKGQWAIDIKGTGSGRGAGRLIYEIFPNSDININEIITNHDY